MYRTSFSLRTRTSFSLRTRTSFSLDTMHILRISRACLSRLPLIRVTSCHSTRTNARVRSIHNARTLPVRTGGLSQSKTEVRTRHMTEEELRRAVFMRDFPTFAIAEDVETLFNDYGVPVCVEIELFCMALMVAY
jgi:hypothetical protein